jgi:hypothetical protein
LAGRGGFGGGAGSNDVGAGGGGAGFGGAIFLREGAILQMRGCRFVDNRAIGGAGGASLDPEKEGKAGQGSGNDIYMMQRSVVYSLDLESRDVSRSGEGSYIKLSSQGSVLREP